MEPAASLNAQTRQGLFFLIGQWLLYLVAKRRGILYHQMVQAPGYRNLAFEVG